MSDEKPETYFEVVIPFSTEAAAERLRDSLNILNDRIEVREVAI